MAYLFTTTESRTAVRPANGKEFTQDELRSLVGGQLNIIEMPGGLYAISAQNAREIGAERNEAAIAGQIIHLAHLEVEGKLPLDQARNPPHEFYGTVVFCPAGELEYVQVQ